MSIKDKEIAELKKQIEIEKLRKQLNSVKGEPTEEKPNEETLVGKMGSAIDDMNYLLLGKKKK
jgi:hypothetical protein